MSEIKCIIIEDEPLARQVLEQYINKIRFLKITGVYEDAIDALEYLREEQPDIIFLDIHLPGITGLAFLKSLPSPPAVIITTAYHQYAIEGYELDITDYLLKPFDFERFLAAVNKFKKHRDGSDNSVEGKKDYFFVNMQQKKVKIVFSDILYVESQKEYVKIFTTAGEHVTKMSTHEIEKLLPAMLFKRVHRSFIVAIDKIRSFTSEMVEINGVHIPVGRSYKEVLDKLC